MKPPFVGQSIPRIEDAALLTGAARFADDIPIRPGTLHAAIVRSPHASAEIESIDINSAASVPGVVRILTGVDVKSVTAPFIAGLKVPFKDWGIAVERVSFGGEPVALVLARDRYTAEDAAERVQVNYRVQPAVVEPAAATHVDSPRVHPETESNVVHERRFSYGNPDAVFAACERRIDIEVRYPRVLCAPMECYVVYAEYDAADHGYQVVANFQGPYGIHTVMARALGVTGSKFRLRTPAYSGGSFGSKLAIFTYIVLMSTASRLTGRPVKWVEDRLEHLSASGSGPERLAHLSAAVSADGTIEALRCDHLEDYGAFVRAPMPGPLYRMHGVTTGAYAIRHLAISNRMVLTNKMPVSLVRGFGGPQVHFAIERLVERIARELRLDPLDVRRRNLVPSGSFPYRTAAGALLDSGDYHRAVDIAVGEGGLNDLRARRDAAREAGRLYGIGYAAAIETSISNMGYLSTLLPVEERERLGPKGGAIATARVNIDANGGVSVTSDSTPQGQGHRTVLAQVVADQLGLDPYDIAVNVEHDSQRDPWTVAAGNYASRFAGAAAGAAHIAARRLRERLAQIASPYLNVGVDHIEFADGRVFDRNNPDNSIPFYRVAGGAHWLPVQLPKDVAPGLSETACWSPPELQPPNAVDEINTSVAYGFIFDFCGVEVDRDTGEVRIDKYVTMHDAGRLLNPAIAMGQVRGSFAQAIGAAFYEDVAYGADGGFRAGNFADYLVPTAMEIPEPLILHMESPSPFTPLGAKGIGEGNTMSTPVCLANAVADAIDVRDIQLPMAPYKLAALIHGAEAPPPPGETADVQAITEPISGHELTGRGECTVRAAPGAVWQALLDPETLAATIPGCQRVETLGEHTYRATAKVGVGPVRGEFQGTVTLTDLNPPHGLHMQSDVYGPLGASVGHGELTLEAHDGGTRLGYTYRLAISGKLAAVGGRLLDGAARALVGQFFASLARQLGGEPLPVAWWRRIWHWIWRLGVNTK